MVLRAKEPKRSPISSCAGPKTRRKSLARNLPNFLAANAVIVFTDHLQDGKRCYHFAKELKGEKRRSVRFQRERSPLGLTVPRMLLVCADEVIEKGRCLLRCMSPVLAHRDMPTASDNVRFREKTGSSPPTAKMKRLTPTGVRQESWQRIGGESPPWGKDQPSAPTPSDARRPARADVKRSQGRPRAKY